MKDQLIEGKSESIKMQLYEHRLDNLPSEKARKRPNRHTNSLSRLPNSRSSTPGHILPSEKCQLRALADVPDLELISFNSLLFWNGVISAKQKMNSLVECQGQIVKAKWVLSLRNLLTNGSSTISCTSLRLIKSGIRGKKVRLNY
ncbi:hypothetical protein E3N88_40195 [Mikania micrantha]|uniref:Uncharacterized protein n=1 Tax=Mikania micrantha TaxID=192012 RepID=A0A5N6LCQ2_9ASTR|nr:hypothetical protein E3N88_44207 [Mikania micrantha]KAD2393218.1 hypothetical protein E3N88_40195 [Mikania micrantha]